MNFFDYLGRLHTKPVTEYNGLPTNNAYTYSFYYQVLTKKNIEWKGDKDLAELIEVMPFSRHPYKPGQPPISHDEITGVCGLDIMAARDICGFLSVNHNQFCDIPGFVPTPFYKLNPFKVIPALYTVYKEENQRSETLNHPVMHPIAFYQQPQYRWFYKRAAGINPSLFEKVVFTLTRFVSILNWKKDDPNLLLVCSLEHLYQKDLEFGIEGKFIDKLLFKKIHKMYPNEFDMVKHKTKDISPEYHDVHPWFTKE